MTGYRSKTLGDWLWALDHVKTLDRATVAHIARSKYTLEAVRPIYVRAFRELWDLYEGPGWTSRAHHDIRDTAG